MPRHLARSLCLPALLLALAGCTNLRPSADPTRFYVLHAGPSADAVDKTNAPLLSVLDVRLPAYLDASKIAVHGPGYEMDYAEWHRWGEDLNAGVTRVLAEGLDQALPGFQVETGRRRLGEGAGPAVEVEFERFEGQADGAVWVSARYVIVGADRRAIRHQGYFRFQGAWDPQAYGTLVESLSEALRQLANEIAQAVPVEPAS